MQRIRNIPIAGLLVLGGMFSTPATADSDELFGRLFNTASGLSHSKVYAVMQDSLGFLWIGTNEGLNKYDGYSFQQFRYQPDTVSLSSNSIRCLAEGSNGTIWVGTDHGLNKLDRIRGYLWTHYMPGRGDSIHDEIIHSICIGRTGEVWMRTDRSLVMLDPDGEEYQYYDLYFDANDPPESNESYSMLLDTAGRLWMGTGNGLQVLDTKSGELLRYAAGNDVGLTGDRVRKVYIDREGRMWCGTEKGLFLFDENRHRFLDAAGFITGLGRPDVLSIAQNRKGEILVGTTNALLRVQPDLSRSESFDGFNRPDLYTRFDNIHGIYEDRSEILWLATDAGMVKIDQKPRKFQTVNTSSTGWSGLSSSTVTSIFQDENGDLWIGTDGKGLNLFPSGSRRSVHFHSHAGESVRTLANDRIRCITRDREGNLWLGTENGPCLRRKDSEGFTDLCRGEENPWCEALERQQVNDVCEDRNGTIWIAASNGIHRYDPAGRNLLSFKRIQHGSELLELQDVLCIREDARGRIWFGSSVGLIQYIPDGERFEIFQAGIPAGSSNINNNTVLSLHATEDGNLWIGTASGLNRYDPENNSFEFFGDPVELSELRILGILEDARGNLWMSSDRGLVMYDPVLETFIQYGASDGLGNFEFLQGSCFRHPNGKMFFGGTPGLLTFHPDSIPYNPYPPELSFTQFIRYREQGGMSKPIALDRVSTVIVPRGVQIVTVRFSALEFTAPEKNRYLYKMVRKGQDGLWIHNGEQHYVTFYNLSPGKYTLSIKGSNNDLLFSEVEVQLGIVIQYPFWNRAMAFLLYLASGTVVLVVFVRLRTRSLRISNRILREKEMSAKEIERQREDLASKNKNITDSINYARRIQHALLPTDESFQNLLPDSFVLFKPKDIVSGDFYWINQHGKKVYVAAVDCTGHGVPGAFVSIIGFELFRKITASDQGSNPAMILDTLNDNFTDIFSDGEQVYLNDGMDLSLCIIDREEKSLDYSGAFNPLYLVRDETIVEVKADRFSVGADVHFSTERKLFKSHKIFLQKDDILYMFSDGYADQFGGPEGKKFKYRRFRHLLLTIHKLPMEKQKSILNASIEEWMSDMDQVDDILVIGIRP